MKIIVIASSFAAIALVISAVSFWAQHPGMGWSFGIIAVFSFVLGVFVGGRNTD